MTKVALSSSDASAVAIAASTVLLAEPSKGIMKKTPDIQCGKDDDDDDDEVFWGSVSTKEVVTTLQKLKEEHEPKPVDHQKQSVKIDSPSNCDSLTAPPKTVQFETTQQNTAKNKAADRVSQHEHQSSESSHQCSTKTKKSGIPRRSGLPQPKFKSRHSHLAAKKLSAFASPAREQSMTFTNTANQLSFRTTVDPIDHALDQTSKNHSITNCPKETMSYSTVSQEPLISLSPIATTVSQITQSCHNVVASPLISFSPQVKADSPAIDTGCITAAPTVGSSLLAALEKAKKPKK